MEDGDTGHCIDSDSGTDGTRHDIVHGNDVGYLKAEG